VTGSSGRLLMLYRGACIVAWQATFEEQVLK
jgi:hypothetical protein